MVNSQDAVPVHPAGALEAARDAAVVCDLEPLRVLAVSGRDAAAFWRASYPAM